jgi:ABC-type multidrug transport system permease subunit
MQQLSTELTAAKISALAEKTRQAKAGISNANSVLVRAESDGTAQASAEMDSNVRNARLINSQTNSMLSKNIAELKNSLSFIIVPNEVAGRDYTSSADIQAALGLLATGDAQQAVFQQIGIYGALEQSNALVARDTEKIYANAKSVAAQSAEKSQTVSFASDILDTSGRKLDEIVSDSQKARVEPLTLDIIEPYGSGRAGLDFLLPNILALVIFQGAAAGLGRAIAGERQDGSMTRVFLTPTSNVTIIVGTLIFYLLLETFRSSLIVFAAIALFGVLIKGSLLSIMFIICLYAMGSTAIGMIISVFAKSQEQYMAISALISFPVIFLAGVFSPIQTLPQFLQGVTTILPTTYAADALRGVMIKGFELSLVANDLVALLVFSIVAISLSVVLFKRELV